jgi:hypothetical protein
VEVVRIPQATLLTFCSLHLFELRLIRLIRLDPLLVMRQPHHGRPIFACAIKESRLSKQRSYVSVRHARIDSCCTVTWKYAITINCRHYVAIFLLTGSIEEDQKSRSHVVTSVEPPQIQKLTSRDRGALQPKYSSSSRSRTSDFFLLVS